MDYQLIRHKCELRMLRGCDRDDYMEVKREKTQELKNLVSACEPFDLTIYNVRVILRTIYILMCYIWRM